MEINKTDSRIARLVDLTNEVKTGFESDVEVGHQKMNSLLEHLITFGDSVDEKIIISATNRYLIRNCKLMIQPNNAAIENNWKQFVGKIQDYILECNDEELKKLDEAIKVLFE